MILKTVITSLAFALVIAVGAGAYALYAGGGSSGGGYSSPHYSGGGSYNGGNSRGGNYRAGRAGGRDGHDDD